jgi:hypothetical protein
MRVCGQRHALQLYPLKRDPVPIVLEAGWAPGTVWTAAQNFAPTVIRSPKRPSRGDSLYWNDRHKQCDIKHKNYSILSIYFKYSTILEQPIFSLTPYSSNISYMNKSTFV